MELRERVIQEMVRVDGSSILAMHLLHLPQIMPIATDVWSNASGNEEQVTPSKFSSIIDAVSGLLPQDGVVDLPPAAQAMIQRNQTFTTRMLQEYRGSESVPLIVPSLLGRGLHAVQSWPVGLDVGDLVTFSRDRWNSDYIRINKLGNVFDMLNRPGNSVWRYKCACVVSGGKATELSLGNGSQA